MAAESSAYILCSFHCIFFRTIYIVHKKINGTLLLNMNYPLKNHILGEGSHGAQFMTFTASPLQMPTEELSWLRFTYHGSMGPWGPMEGCNEGSINHFHYFRRLKGITHSPIIKLPNLKCQITLLWGKVLSISSENWYYLMLMSASDWQVCMHLINKV